MVKNIIDIILDWQHCVCTNNCAKILYHASPTIIGTHGKFHVNSLNDMEFIQFYTIIEPDWKF